MSHKIFVFVNDKRCDFPLFWLSNWGLYYDKEIVTTTLSVTDDSKIVGSMDGAC